MSLQGVMIARQYVKSNFNRKRMNVYYKHASVCVISVIPHVCVWQQIYLFWLICFMYRFLKPSFDRYDYTLTNFQKISFQQKSASKWTLTVEHCQEAVKYSQNYLSGQCKGWFVQFVISNDQFIRLPCKMHQTKL